MQSMYKQKHLTILLRQDRPAHRHAHPKRKWTSRSSVGRAGPGYLSGLVQSHRLEPPGWASNPRPKVHDHDHDHLQSPRRQPLTGFGCQVGNVRTENVLSHQTCPTHDPRCLAKRHDLSNCRPLLNAGPDNHFFLFRWEGLLLLATRLLIGRTYRAIRWPSLIGQTHGRRGNSHPSGRSPERRHLWLRPPPRLRPRA